MTILLSARPEETRAAVVEAGCLTDFLMERSDREDLVGRIYKGVVKNAVPAVKGVFLDIGIGKNAFLRKEDCLDPSRLPTEGSALLVQVVKDSTDTKGPLVTGKISLPGRYAVLLTDSAYIGISKKIRSEDKRTRLRKAAGALCPAGLGCIVRTAADAAEASQVEQDLERLARQWDIIQKRSRIEKGPALLYRGSDLLVRILRDFLGSQTEAVITDSEEACRRLQDLTGGDGRIRFEEGNLFKNHGVEEQVNMLFAREVPLPSGGSVIIDETEALTAIDVNSGSFHRKGIPHGEAAYLVNREAAVVIARQIRMRGIGGMILIDFIDMEEEKQKQAIVEALRRETARDRVKTVVLGMTALGLVEMTRKRTAHRLGQICCDPCPLCGGTGQILSRESVVIRIHRALEEEKRRGGMAGPVLIQCHPDIAALLEEPEEQFFLKSFLLRPVRIEAGKNPHREVFSILADNKGITD